MPPAPSLNRVRARPFQGNRQYFHRPTRLGAWKVRLALLALALTVGWVLAAVLLRPAHLHAVATHGPVARAHARFADQCALCHVPFGDPDCGGGASPFGCRDRWRSFRCQSCHPGRQLPAGGPYSADDVAWEARNYSPHYDRFREDKQHLLRDDESHDCSSCHREHQGADFALTRVADATCARCHQDLGRLHSDSRAPQVTGFPTDHPEFQVVEQNQKRAASPATTDRQWRALKFNHALHLATGMTDPANHGNPDASFRLEHVAEPYRKQYEPFARPNGRPTDNIRLECSACHQLATDPPIPPGGRAGGAARLPAANLAPAVPGGAYYLPVTFEQHCQGCHRLNLTPLPSEAGAHVKAFDVPHRLRKPEVERFVRAEVTRQVEARGNLFAKVLLPPNDRLDTPKPVPFPIPPTLRDATNRLVAEYTRMLYEDPDGLRPDPRKPADAAARPELSGGHSCYKCHRREGDDVRPARGLTLYMRKARFDHAAHRDVICAKCHDVWDPKPAADPGADARATADPAGKYLPRYAYTPGMADEPVNVPAVQTCRQCHAPPSLVVEGKPATGVRHDCQTCHTYHGPPRPPAAGPGARDVAAADHPLLNPFLRGVRGP